MLYPQIRPVGEAEPPLESPEGFRGSALFPLPLCLERLGPQRPIPERFVAEEFLLEGFVVPQLCLLPLATTCCLPRLLIPKDGLQPTFWITVSQNKYSTALRPI